MLTNMLAFYITQPKNNWVQLLHTLYLLITLPSSQLQNIPDSPCPVIMNPYTELHPCTIFPYLTLVSVTLR